MREDREGAAAGFASPFSLGSVRIPNRVVLAPMAGLTTSAYRRTSRRTAPGW